MCFSSLRAGLADYNQFVLPAFPFARIAPPLSSPASKRQSSENNFDECQAHFLFVSQKSTVHYISHGVVELMNEKYRHLLALQSHFLLLVTVNELKADTWLVVIPRYCLMYTFPPLRCFFVFSSLLFSSYCFLFFPFFSFSFSSFLDILNFAVCLFLTV